MIIRLLCCAGKKQVISFLCVHALDFSFFFFLVLIGQGGLLGTSTELSSGPF